jgi:hypothetical protein
LIDNLADKPFEIDCIDIEVHGFVDHQPPLFKGPGIIYGNQSGPLSFKVYNQSPLTEATFRFLRKIDSEADPKSFQVRLFAKDYEGMELIGGWSIPRVNLPQSGEVRGSVIHGEFNQLWTRVRKLEGDPDKDVSELIFPGILNLPYSGRVEVKQCHGTEILSTQGWNDHHNLTFKSASIVFQESTNRNLTHIKASHYAGFNPPYVEHWITEALIFITARIVYPRMVIRHCEDYAHVFIRATPKSATSGMPPPFSRDPQVSGCTWDVFLSYLAKCEKSQSFEYISISTGFYQLILASNGTLQGFLTSLSLYIENCINQIFSVSKKKKKDKDGRNKKEIEQFMLHVENWSGNQKIKDRAKRLFHMLNSPDPSKSMDLLIAQGVIHKIHKNVWKKVRHYLAHGGLIDDFSKEEEYWQFRNYLLPMAYRLTFRILGYKGKVLDYDGKNFAFVEFAWDDNVPSK